MSSVTQQQPPDRRAVTGVILAGGQARRMGGRDKGLIPFNGRPMVAHALDLLRPQVAEVIINANRNLDDYRTFGCPVVSDPQEQIDSFSGPLAGMLAALRCCSTDYLLTAPCDSPLLADDYAARMLAALPQTSAGIVVAGDGERLQPVFTLLATRLADDLHAYLLDGQRKIDRWFNQYDKAVAVFADRTEMFSNINTPEELERLQNAASATPPASR